MSKLISIALLITLLGMSIGMFTLSMHGAAIALLIITIYGIIAAIQTYKE